MSLDLIILLIQVSLLLLLNIVATYSSLKTTFHYKQRRNIQITFIWLIPLVGAISIIQFNRNKRPLNSEL